MGNADLDITLLDCDPAKDGCPAEGLKPQAGVTYAQLAIFTGSCPPDEVLAQGVVTGAIKLQTVNVALAFSDVGELKKAKYGFAALLRRDDCSVIGFGCTPADLKVHKHVTIELSPVLPLASHVGACQAPSVCQSGLCGEGVADASVPDADADAGEAATKPICTLDPIAGNAGADLAPAMANASANGPAAVGTPSGFISIYREANADSARVVRQLIGDDGTLKAMTPEPVPACPSLIANGIAATWNPTSNQGLQAVAWPECADAGADASGTLGLRFSSFTHEGVKTAEGPPNPPVYENKFLSVNGATPAPNDSAFLLAALQKSDTVFEPLVYDVTGALTASYKMSPIKEKGTFVRVAAATGVFAVAHDKPVEGGTAVDLYLSVPNGTLKTVQYPGSTNAALAAWSDQVMLVQPTSGGLAWSVRTPTAELAKGMLSAGTVTSLDVVAMNEHFIVVAGELHKITLFRFDIDGVKITAPTQPIVLPLQLGQAKLDRFDGTMMAAAGMRNRLFITWLNKTGPVGEGSSPGGYALLQCE